MPAKMLLFILLVSLPVASAQEMATLAQAEQICAVDTGYYVSLETLNDIPAPSTSQTPYDGLNNEGGTYVLRPTRGAFEANRLNLVTAFNPWQGPYVNFQSGRTQTGSVPYDRGSPLDPWGTPYYLFSPLGMIRGDEGVITLELYGDRFDRYTLISLGPDGVQSADDLSYQFGGGVTVFAVTSVGPVTGAGLRPASRVGKAMPPNTPLSGGTFNVNAGSRIIVRGVNFPSSATTQVMWGGVELSNRQRWTNREVELTLPAGLTGTQLIRLVNGPNQSLPATLIISQPPAAVARWTLFD